MKIEKLYDTAAKQYHEADDFDIYKETHKIALNQLKQHVNTEDQLRHLELGIGHGQFLTQYQEAFKQATLFGVDISANMLASAQKNLTFTPIQSSFQNLSKQKNLQDIDTIAAHYICAYIPLDELLTQMNTPIKTNGLVSLATTTFESYPEFMRQMNTMENSLSPRKRFVYATSQRGLKKTHVPENFSEIEKIATKHGFEILERKRLEVSCSVKNAKEFSEHALNGGWGVNVMDYRFIPTSLMWRAFQFFANAFDYPLEDKSISEIVLLRNKL